MVRGAAHNRMKHVSRSRKFGRLAKTNGSEATMVFVADHNVQAPIMGTQDPRTVSPSEGTKSTRTGLGPRSSAHKVAAAGRRVVIRRHAMTVEGLQQGRCGQGMEIAHLVIGATDEPLPESGIAGPLGET